MYDLSAPQTLNSFPLVSSDTWHFAFKLNNSTQHRAQMLVKNGEKAECTHTPHLWPLPLSGRAVNVSFKCSAPCSCLFQQEVLSSLEIYWRNQWKVGCYFEHFSFRLSPLTQLGLYSSSDCEKVSRFALLGFKKWVKVLPVTNFLMKIDSYSIFSVLAAAGMSRSFYMFLQLFDVKLLSTLSGPWFWRDIAQQRLNVEDVDCCVIEKETSGFFGVVGQR